MATDLTLRPPGADDFAAWLPLWDGYNAFYGRHGASALPPAISRLTWQRFLDPAEPVHALLAWQGGQLLGLAHYLFHRNTLMPHHACYLQDLFTVPEARGRGVAPADCRRGRRGAPGRQPQPVLAYAPRQPCRAPVV